MCTKLTISVYLAYSRVLRVPYFLYILCTLKVSTCTPCISCTPHVLYLPSILCTCRFPRVLLCTYRLSRVPWRSRRVQRGTDLFHWSPILCLQWSNQMGQLPPKNKSLHLHQKMLIFLLYFPPPFCMHLPSGSLCGLLNKTWRNLPNHNVLT